MDLKICEINFTVEHPRVYSPPDGGFTTSTHFDDSIAGLTLERFMSLSKSKCELKEA
jgi:hypothetical protein